MMGRQQKRKRLANRAFRMAMFEMTDSTINTNSFPRPIHSAFQGKKIICPENECSEKQPLKKMDLVNTMGDSQD